ncbi:hypothetical protein EVAR_26536_1 [Eumeta japonica]|uniref:Integrase catalytic domain-containing protein n=1 Tax=Eumeta variegata TaxID=151549 RepID=A0A4C1YNU4_EUMVA|nr:hypothetical protein EVAR_26536_1 [Eumeta japonica]
MLAKFWKIEEVPKIITDTKNVECESTFRDTRYRYATGRHVVRLPLRSDRPQLGESKQLAFKRFHSLEKRLQSNESLREKHIAFTREYINFNHTTTILTWQHVKPCNGSGVFNTVQTDFAGTFYAKSSKLRNAKLLKAYLCVTCVEGCTSRLIGDLSTEGFLAALTRLTSRRGLPGTIRSDFGSNFVRTNKHLNDVQKILSDSMIQCRIK